MARHQSGRLEIALDPLLLFRSHKRNQSTFVPTNRVKKKIEEMDMEKNRVFDTWAEWHYSEGVAYLVLHSHRDPIHRTKVVNLKSLVGNGATAKCITEYGSNTITVDCVNLVPLWPKKKGDKVL